MLDLKGLAGRARLRREFFDLPRSIAVESRFSGKFSLRSLRLCERHLYFWFGCGAGERQHFKPDREATARCSASADKVIVFRQRLPLPSLKTMLTRDRA